MYAIKKSHSDSSSSASSEDIFLPLNWNNLVTPDINNKKRGIFKMPKNPYENKKRKQNHDNESEEVGQKL
jgi:hypothetical protein